MGDEPRKFLKVFAILLGLLIVALGLLLLWHTYSSPPHAVVALGSAGSLTSLTMA